MRASLNRSILNQNHVRSLYSDACNKRINWVSFGSIDRPVFLFPGEEEITTKQNKIYSKSSTLDKIEN